MRKLLCLLLALTLMLGCGSALAVGDEVAFAPYADRIKDTRPDFEGCLRDIEAVRGKDETDNGAAESD